MIRKQRPTRPPRPPNRPMRVLALGDWHCGHLTGLTPPEYWSRKGSPARAFQEETWKWFAALVERNRPFDVLIHNGDLIDGRGEKSGSTELIVVDRNEQITIAESIIKFIGAREVHLIRGTAYHTARPEDWEDILGSRLPNATIHDHALLEIGGVVFDCSHHIGNSVLPHGRYTATARDMMILDLMRDRPRADVFLRSHVHYSIYLGNEDGQLGVILPAMQGGTKYGKQCHGRTSYGVAIFECEKGAYTWRRELLQPESATPKVFPCGVSRGKRPSPTARRKAVRLAS